MSLNDLLRKTGSFKNASEKSGEFFTSFHSRDSRAFTNLGIVWDGEGNGSSRDFQFYGRKLRLRNSVYRDSKGSPFSIWSVIWIDEDLEEPKTLSRVWIDASNGVFFSALGGTERSIGYGIDDGDTFQRVLDALFSPAFDAVTVAP